jgi:glycerol uptake operon antiterminator
MTTFAQRRPVLAKRPALAQPRLVAFVDRLATSSCCAAIVGEGPLTAALASRVPAIFILRGNGLELSPIVDRAHAAGKLVAAHLDLVDGLRADHRGVAWLARSGVDAIITSHGQLMQAIRDEGAIAIQRLLLSRWSHLDTVISAISRSAPDIVEVLPGVILPSVLRLMPEFDVPVLAGGFIRTVEDAQTVLAAGAVGVTTSSPVLWDWEAGL